MDAPLCGTQVTGNLVKQLLLDHFGPVCERIQSVTASLVGSKTGFLSYVLSVELHWQENKTPDGIPVKLIVKTTTKTFFKDIMTEVGAPPDQDVVDSFDMAELHNSECDIYSILKEADVPLCVAKCYGTRKMLTDSDCPAMIILEDMSLSAKHCNLFVGMSESQLMSVARAAARVHAWSLNTSFDWRSLLTDREEAYSRFRKLILYYVDHLEKSKEKYPEQMSSVNAEKVDAVFRDEQFLRQICLGPELDLPTVLSNGDLWANNLFFETDISSGQASDNLVAIIDWQLGHQGSFFEELAPMFTLSISTSVRRRCTESVFRHYYETLMSLVDTNKFTFPTLQVAYNLFLKFTAMQQILYCCGAVAIVPLFAGNDEKAEYDLVWRAVDSYHDAILALGL